MEIYRRGGFDKPLFIVTLALIAAGLVMVFSSSAYQAIELHNNSLYFLIHQIIGALVGMFLILFIMSSGFPFYQTSVFVYGLLVLTVGLLALCLVMPAIGNTNRWIQLFGLRYQPSELAKISLVLFLAFYLDKKKDRLSELRVLLIPAVVLLIFALLILKEPDYGTAVLIFVICAMMFFIAGVRLINLAFLGLFALGLFIFFLYAAPYRMARIAAFLSPDSSINSGGFQAYQSRLAIGSGGLLGVSIGQSSQKMFFLPCAHTDYIYAIVGEELGLLGAIGVLLLFGIFIWRGLVIAKRAPNLFSQMVAAGLTLGIGVQALLNVTVALDLGPTTGFPLPLFSFGRSSLMTTLFAVGILLHISQRKTNSRRK